MDEGRRSKGLGKSCILLIVISGVERLAFKGVASNLITYLTDVVNMSNSSAAKTVNNWCGLTSILSLLGALVADSYWDRYSTILASSFLYVLGLAALTSTALLRARSTTSKTSSSLSLFWSLYLISIGQGGYNPCLQAFAADQLESEDELPSTKEEQNTKNKKSSFFQWSYFSICTGSLLGVTLMAYVQDTFGWGLGFAIPTMAMVASVVCLSCGTKTYTHKQAKGGKKPMEEMIQAIKETTSKMLNGRIILPEKDADNFELELQETPLCNQDCDSSKTMDENPDNEIVTFDVKRLLRLLPIWITLLMFAVVFQQPATFFTKQGMTMKRSIGSSFVIPPATLQSAITISIVLLMPFYDKMIIPFFQIITRTDKGINVMQRMGIGMVLSVAAMAIAAIVETKRLKISNSGLLESHTETVPMSIFWLLPQYILLGISDVFTVVGMQEFFYTQVPSTMRTMGIALYLSVFGVGSFLSALLISLIELVTCESGNRQSWFSDDLKQARLDNYYWLLALLSTLSFLMFICLCKFYNGRNTSATVNCK